MDINTYIDEHINVVNLIRNNSKDIKKIIKMIEEVYESNGCIYFIGNGGSAADCQHMAAELVGRFKLKRNGLAAHALTTDTSIITSIANDFNYDEVFSRQIEALVNENDMVMGISTSGNSMNIIKAIEMANKKKAKTVCLLGNKESILKDISTAFIVVESYDTARIQETHILIEHIICQEVEKWACNYIKTDNFL